MAARTIKDKADALAAASSARRKAQQEEAAALNALSDASDPDDAVLGELETITDFPEGASYAMVGGKRYRLKLVGYIGPMPAPPASAPPAPQTVSIPMNPTAVPAPAQKP